MEKVHTNSCEFVKVMLRMACSVKIDPKIFIFQPKLSALKMAHPVPQYMGVTSFSIQPGNDVQEKLGKHLVVNRFIAAHSVFDIQFCQ